MRLLLESLGVALLAASAPADAVDIRLHRRSPSHSGSIIITTRTVTVKAASSASLLPTYTPTDGITCPGENNRTVKINNGADSYYVNCYIDFTDSDITTLWTDTATDCMQQCSDWKGTKSCEAAVWRPSASDGPCYLKAAAQDPSTDYGLLAFRKREKPSQTTVTVQLTTTTTAATQTKSADEKIIAKNTTSTSTQTSTTGSGSAQPVTLTRTVPYNSSSSSTGGMTTRTIDFKEFAKASTSSTPTTKAATTKAATDETKPVIPDETRPDGSFIPCGVLNYRSNLFLLRTHVAFGDPSFEGLYIKGQPEHAPASAPLLTPTRALAGAFFADASTYSVALWHGGCAFSGMTVALDRDADALGAVFLDGQVGTARMAPLWGELVWLNDRFGSWLACRAAGDGEGKDDARVELLWWDVVANKAVDEKRCAKVRLVLENL